MDAETYMYDEKIEPVTMVEFTAISHNEIKRSSAFGKDSAGIESYDLYVDNEPKPGGLIDTKMGTTDNFVDCSTCGLSSKYCVGHFGHIDLADPVFHIGYLPYVKKILGCICLRCSKLLVNKKEDELMEILKHKTGKARLNAVREMAKSVSVCQKGDYDCGTPVSKIKIEIKSAAINIISETSLKDVTTLDGTFDGKKIRKEYLTPNDCYNILKKISDIDCIIMGINPTKTRPEMMIYKVLPVPPVNMRPPAKVESMSSTAMQDDLTIKIAEIIKCNKRVRDEKEKITDTGGKYKQEHIYLLRYQVAVYHENEGTTLPQSEQKGKRTKSLSARIKGKEGRVRGNLMGKRVDFSARSVITPDPSLDIDELGVPIDVAKTITFREVVTPQNIDKLRKHVQNGRHKYPGANFIFRSKQLAIGRSGQVDLRYKPDVTIEIGDIVERHCVSGDMVLLNRQPTLHKQSMQGHRAKVIDDPNLATFRLNVAITTPYNADFDGDEMNIFVPQSIQTQIELENIANVRKQVITPKHSMTIIGIVQDGLLGSYNLTQPEMRIDRKSAMNILSSTSATNYNIFRKKKDYYGGTELFSVIIPSKINLIRKDMVIKNGQLDPEKGVMKKAYLGDGKKTSVIGLIWDQYGMNETRNFIDNVQRLVNNFNLWNGFTVGIGDIDISKQTKKAMLKIFETKKLEVDHLITMKENNPDLYDEDSFENKLYNDLNVIRDEASKIIIDNFKKDNKFGIMAKSGSKGGPMNISQMGGCVGQQAVEGKRIQKRIHGRTLPFFAKDDDSAKARGFVEHPFVDGLELHEFYAHNMSGREGMIDTAIKTAESGYIQRKLVKSTEDGIVKYDGTVRSARDNIIQYVYGDSGISTEKQISHDLKLIIMSNKEVEDMFKFSSSEIKKVDMSDKDNDKYYKDMLGMRDMMRESQLKSFINFITVNSNYMLPVNLYRILTNVTGESLGKTKLTVKHVINRLDDILKYENTKIISLSKEQASNTKSFKYLDEMTAKTVFKVALHMFLAPKRCVMEYKFSKEQFDKIVDEVIYSFNRSVVEAGEMVGVVSAQSIGEPVTQLTLNTFHHTGIGTMGTANLGVPRIKEILNLSKSMKTPIMSIYMTKEFQNNDVMGNRIASYLQYITIEDMRKRIDVMYDPNPTKKGGFMEKDHVYNVFYSHSKNRLACQPDIGNTPWLLRIELDREKMINKEVTLLDIKSKFCDNWEKRYTDLKGIRKEERVLLEKITNCAILSNDDNDKKPVVHIRFNMTEVSLTAIENFVNTIVDKFKLKGISGIESTNLGKSDRVVMYNDNTGEIEYGQQYIIYTSGINMTDIRYINGINLSHTICNDIIEIYETLGIEAARTVLIKELKEVFTSSGKSFNTQHLGILVDIMTNSGTLVSVDRHGMGKLDNDPLPRITFERSVDQAQQAAVFNEKDYMQSVSARIMMGQVIKGGTGLCDVMLDIDQIKKSEYVEELDVQYRSNFNEITTNAIVDDNVDNEEGGGFFMPEM